MLPVEAIEPVLFKDVKPGMLIRYPRANTLLLATATQSDVKLFRLAGEYAFHLMPILTDSGHFLSYRGYRIEVDPVTAIPAHHYDDALGGVIVAEGKPFVLTMEGRMAMWASSLSDTPSIINPTGIAFMKWRIVLDRPAAEPLELHSR